jgi:thymidylate synthase
LRQYLDLARHVLENGKLREDRTGTGVLSTFGTQTRYDLREGFPLVTTKYVDFRKVAGELLWFLSGSTNANECAEKYGFKVWRKWADEDGNLGPLYGYQWRSWDVMDCDYEEVRIYQIDQIAHVIESIRNNPTSRRLLVNAWNVGELDEMALPPCHFAFQFYVDDGELSCQLYQRSADVFLGVPYNIASYALLTEMIAQVTGLKAGELVHTTGDTHIYTNHLAQVKTQLQREPKPLPQLWLNGDISDIDAFTLDDIRVINYNHYPPIHGEVSV